MTAEPGAAIELAAVPNLRDVGGWATADGATVRRGQVFRSTELSKLDGDDEAAFTGLGIRRAYDLRTASERETQPDRLPDGVELVVCDVLADHPGASAARMADVLADPSALVELLAGSDIPSLFADVYRGFLTLPSAVDSYRDLFTGLADAAHRPALYHCTTGKDRTGWATAALLLLLGVGRDDVMAEYLLTNAQLLPALQPTMDRFADAGGDPGILEPLLGVRPEYLQASLDELDERHGGSIEAYFTDALDLGPDVQTSLRDALLDDA